MRLFKAGFLVILAIVALVAANSMFIIDQTEQALVLQFGEMKRVEKEPGLYFKVPFIQKVVYFDKRLLEVDSKAEDIIVRNGESGQNTVGKDEKVEIKKPGTIEYNRLFVDTFTRFKITDPVRFYKTLGTRDAAENRISNIIDNALPEVLTKYTLQDVVRDNRSALMAEVAQLVRVGVKNLGVHIVDVRFKRADFPDKNREAVFEDMRTNYKAEADEYRGQGQGSSQTIKENANLYVEQTKAAARRQAEIIRGEADAKRANIFAKYLGQDPEFYAFYRSMQAYEKGLASKDTRLVISPNSPFFKYFKAEK